MTNKTKYLLHNIVLFMLATFLPKAMIFLMVPLYTSCLTTNEYGTVDLLNSTVSLLLPILTLQVQDAVMRYAIQKEYNKKEVFTVGFTCVCRGGMLLFLVCVIGTLIGGIKLESMYLLFLFINYFTGATGNIFSYFCRGIDEVKVITISSILNTITTISCNLIFLLVFQWGLVGYLVANSIGALVKSIYIFVRAKLYKYLCCQIQSKEISKEMIRFSIPMIFSALSWWINNTSDKYILTYFSGISVVGIYAVAAKIPAVLTAFTEVISKSFSISAIKEFDPNDEDGFLGNSYSNISFFGVIICSLLILCNILLAKVMFANDFFEAWKYCPPLLIAVLFNQLSLTCENMLVAVGRTKIISTTAIVGAAINTILNLILIPVFGAYGAAVATIIAFVCTWIFRYIILKKYISMKNNLKEEVVAYILVIMQMIVAFYGNQYIYIQILILVALIIVYRVKIKNCMLLLIRCTKKKLKNN